MEEFMKQKTECAVCFKVFKEPRILPCLHTFCLECLDRIRKSSLITCPYCTVTSDYGSMRVDFNAKEMVDMRIKQEEMAKANEPQKRTRKQHLQNYCRDLELVIEDFKGSKKEIQNNVEDLLEIKTSILNISHDLREKCVVHIHNQFDQIDTGVIEHCRERNAECETATAAMDERLNILEKELVSSQELLTMEAHSAVTMDYIRELGEKLQKLSEKPKLPLATWNLQMIPNEDWEKTEIATVHLPKQESTVDADAELSDDSAADAHAPPISMMDLTRKEFKLLQEKHLDVPPYTVRVVHEGIWVCTEHGISVHADEIHGLEAVQRIQNQEELGKRVYDVAECGEQQVAAAAEKGLFILYITGQVLKKLSSGRHTSVKTSQCNKLVAVGDLETSSLAVLYIYAQTEGQWKRVDMIYLPETCQRGHHITIECSDALIYVCNADSDRIYLLSWSGDIVSEHGVRNAIRMEKEGGFIAYHFNKSIEKKQCNYSGIVSQPRICMRDNTGVLIADHDNYRFQVFDEKNKWHIIKFSPLACVSAVIFRDKLYVACRFNDVQLGAAAKYNIMKNCLQLYKIY